MKLISKFIYIIICCAAFQLSSDEVLLKNGATLPGKILKITKGEILFKTDFAGNITIKLDKVESFKTETAANLEYGKRQTVVGTVDYTNGQALIMPQKKVKEKDFKKSETAPGKENQTVDIDPLEPILTTEDFKNLWPVGENHPDYVKPVKHWKHKITLDLTRENGNTDEDEFEGSIKTIYEKDGKIFKAYAGFDIGNKNSKNTDEEYTGGVDYEVPLSLDHMRAWYSRFRWEKDRFDDLDGRFTIAGGYSHYITRDPQNITFRLRAGFAERIERYRIDSDSDNEKLAGDFQALFVKNFGHWGKFTTEVFYAPVFEEPGEDYLYYLNTYHELPYSLSETIKLSLKIGYNREYTSQPSDESKKGDNEYYLKLVLDF